METKPILRNITLHFFFLSFFTLLQSGYAQNSWSQKNDLPSNGRSNSSSLSINGKLYIIGGSPPYGPIFNDVWEYNPSNDTWTQKANFPGQARAYATSFTIGTKGYLGIGAQHNSGIWVPLSDFWEYDPSTDIWSQKADFPPGPRWFATGFSIKDKGYIGTGSNNNGTYPDFWEYDPSTDTWTQKADFPRYRFGSIGFSLHEKGYIGFGSYCGIAYPELFQYLPDSNIWVQKTSMPGVGRWKSACFTMNNKAYMGIGVSTSNTSLDDFYEYNDSSDTWLQVANFGGGIRRDAVGFSVNDKGYIATGYGSYYYDDLWEFSADTTILNVTLNNNALNISLYPIPTLSQLNITSDENIERIKIINETGDIIFQKYINSNITTIDVHHISQGIYFVHIINGKNATIKKIVKQ